MSVQSPVSAPPFSARCRAVRLDVRGIDHLHLARSSASGKLAKQPLPHATPRPTHEAIVDRCRWAVLRWAIAPPAAALQNVQDAADHPPVIHAIFTAYVRRQKRLDLLPLLVAQPKQGASHHHPRSLSTQNHYPIQPSTLLLSFDPSMWNSKRWAWCPTVGTLGRGTLCCLRL